MSNTSLNNRAESVSTNAEAQQRVFEILTAIPTAEEFFNYVDENLIRLDAETSYREPTDESPDSTSAEARTRDQSCDIIYKHTLSSKKPELQISAVESTEVQFRQEPTALTITIRNGNITVLFAQEPRTGGEYNNKSCIYATIKPDMENPGDEIVEINANDVKFSPDIVDNMEKFMQMFESDLVASQVRSKNRTS